MTGDGVDERLRALGRGLLRAERRRVRAFRRWIETTSNLVHLSVLVAIPLLLGVVTALAEAVEFLPYLLFPPLASGSYTLFSNPESHQASPRRFVGGLTAGAFCGWLALAATTVLWYGQDPASYELNAAAVAAGLFLTGAVTWALDIEEASAFATALLVHVTGTSQLTYVLSVAVSSALVAGVFALWREYVYEERAQFLYESTRGDDHVLVPMRGERPTATAAFGARLAAAHDAGKVVLLDVVDDDAAAEQRRAEIADGSDAEAATTTADPDPVDPGDISQQWAEYYEEPAATGGTSTVESSAATLESESEWIEGTVGVPCEVVVAVGRGSLSKTISRAAAETNCDLIATPYETESGKLAPHIRSLFGGDTDLVVHRSVAGRTEWRRVLVPVRRAGDVAHSMLEFATRLAGSAGRVSVANCIDDEDGRREAEEMLADLAETADGPVETRVARTSIQTFLADTGPEYDVVIMGASQDRSTVSRLIKPPTFERIRSVETDVVVVDRNY
jgi:hypothetical protein